MTKKQKFTKYFGIFCVIALIFIAISVIVGQFYPLGEEEESDMQPTANLTVTKETYISSCVKGGLENKNSALNTEYYQTYCGCIYDRGVAQYGYDEFIAKSQRLDQTNDFSELNDLVNQCIVVANGV